MSIRRSVRVFPIDEVTTISPNELPPEEGGLKKADIDAIWNAVVRYYKTGVQPAMGICIRRGGKVILERTIGHASGNSPDDAPGAPLKLATPETLFNLFSGSKAMTAMLIHHLDDKGLVHLDDAVAEYIPEFAAKGKSEVTIRHLLAHRAGIPTTNGELDLGVLSDKKRMRDLYSSFNLWYRPGSRVAYHAISAGFILADIVEAVTGKDLNAYMDEVVRGPLGFRSLTWGVKPSQFDQVARDTFTGFDQPLPINMAFRRAFGGTLKDIVDLTNDPRFLTGVVPSGNCFGTPNETSAYFEMLLRGGELNGVQVFNPRSVRRAVRETSFGQFDGILVAPVPYGLGFMLGGKYASLYGANSTRAFGHLGLSNCTVWADPERDISVAFFATGKPAISPEAVAWIAINYTIAARIPRIYPGRTVGGVQY